MKNVSLKNTAAQGFSLVEMLVVIAVIGVIAAIAIPQIGNISGQANTAKDQRNAQNIVSVYAAASAAGATISGSDVTTIVGDLTDSDGVQVSGGAFAGKRFAVPGLSATDITDAQKYIKYDATLGGLVYDKAGVTSGS